MDFLIFWKLVWKSQGGGKKAFLQILLENILRNLLCNLVKKCFNFASDHPGPVVWVMMARRDFISEHAKKTKAKTKAKPPTAERERLWRVCVGVGRKGERERELYRRRFPCLSLALS